MAPTLLPYPTTCGPANEDESDVCDEEVSWLSLSDGRKELQFTSPCFINVVSVILHEPPSELLLFFHSSLST